MKPSPHQPETLSSSPNHLSRMCTPSPWVALIFIALGLAALAPAQTFTTFHNFTGSGGREPKAGVIQDSAGNIYGTTLLGGDLNCENGCGVVYLMNAAGKERVLHRFSGSDGMDASTPVARDGAGNIYGTTWYGGSARYGTAFKIDAGRKETALHDFSGGSDGCLPSQGLVSNKAGDWYGTTANTYCNYSYVGTIFEIDSAGKYTLLHSFSGWDGAYPGSGHLTIDLAGNLYGVTTSGGAYGEGTLYELSAKGKFSVLYSFKGGTSDGCGPWGSVVRDDSGNFYGTTYGCGSKDYGTVWKVSNTGKENILHNFVGGTVDGCNPYAGVARDSKGNLYGATTYCGTSDYGTLYQLSAKGKLTLLHSFGTETDGIYPYGEVLRTSNGALLGTAGYGGTYAYGTVWKYVP